MLHKGHNIPPPAMTLPGAQTAGSLREPLYKGSGEEKEGVIEGTLLYVAQKGVTRGRGPHSTWSRQPPVKFLCLVANEKSDIWRDDSSSYIQKGRG